MDFKQETYLITGITGLIGSLLARQLMSLPEYDEGSIRILAPVRDIEKAKRLFADASEEGLQFVKMDLCDTTAVLAVEQPIDYILHCACVTQSAEMIAHSVETADGIVFGTRAILELANQKKVKSMVYVSSMEAYGSVRDIGHPRKEEELGEVRLEAVRSCYPLGKRMAEHYCHSFWQEYEVPVKIARLAQTFGRGVKPEDNRVYMQFAKAAVEGRDIVLKTQGLSVGNYCASEDVVRAIFLLLEKGENGEAYNVVNEENTMRIREMAELVADKIAGGRIKVRIEIEDASKTGYAPDTELRLSGEKLRKLGWKPSKNLEQMYRDIIEILEKEE